jgi:hypothetical protein
MRTMRALLVLCGICCVGARADVVTFVTPSGSTASGDPVDASATITTGDGTITVTLTNLVANPTDVEQDLSDLFFTIDNGSVTGARYALGKVDSAQLVAVSKTGTPTLGTTDTTALTIGWVLSAVSSTELDLNDLSGLLHAGPHHTIIGPANGSDIYSDANTTIAGNILHNQFIDQTVTWEIKAPNVSADTTITSATFSFGTTAGVEVVGSPSAVPEPSFYGILGLGLAGLLIGVQRQRRTASPQES